MRIIRLESDAGLANDAVYNKLFVFDSDSAELNVFVNNHFKLSDKYELNDILQGFGVPSFSEPYRFILNPKVSNAYSFPFKLFVDITDRCLLNCKHCLTKQLNKGNELPLNKILDIIKEGSQRGLFYLKLGGGEPLLHPNIAQIIETASANGIAVSLSTNALNITPSITKLLVQNRVKVSISIEGPQKINDDIRGEGHFRKAIKAVEILKSEGGNVILRTTLTRKLLDAENLNELIKISDTLSVPLKVSYCRPAGNALDHKLLINFDDYRQYYQVLKILNAPKHFGKIILDEGMQFNQPKTIKNLIYDNRICGAANRSLHINSRGKISPCVFLGSDFTENDSSYTYGDIDKYWRAEVGNQFSRVRSIKTPLQCESCSRLCKYECLATRYSTTGSFEAPDPNCLYNVYLKCHQNA